MTTLQHILCPVDFSEQSQLALDHAVAIARWYEAELTVLHVFTEREPVDVLPALGVRAERPHLQPTRERRQAITQDLHRFVARSGVKGLDVQEIVQEAPDVVAEVLVQTGVQHADLLVLGSHGRSGMPRLALGSVAENVLRSSRAPTLVVPALADHVGFGHAAPFKRLLCPIDFSESSLDALALAMTLAEEGDADLTLLHVVDTPPELVEAALFSNHPLTEIRAKLQAMCEQRLERLIPDAVRTFSTVHTQVVEGRPAQEILRTAEERQSDLIVMGVHGRNPIDMLWFGSKTHAVLRAGRCPVLAVRSSTRC